MTNLEGRVLRRRRAVEPPAGARSELWIMNRLAELLEAPSEFSADPRTVFEELRAASAGGLADYSGVTYARLDAGEALHWPCPKGSDGTPRLFADGFAHPDGRARLVAVRASSPLPGAGPDAGAFQLATGRLLEHYQSGAQTRRVEALSAAQPEVRLSLHPAPAARLGIADGAWVRVRRQPAAATVHSPAQTAGAQPEPVVLARAELSTDVRPDTVFLPFHFPGLAAANQVTEQRTDPISGMPEFKTTRVLVEPAVVDPALAQPASREPESLLAPSTLVPAPREERP